MKKAFINIDIVRIVLAVMVVCIHSLIVDSQVAFYAVNGIARCAVPLFFMLIGKNISLERISSRGFLSGYIKSQANIFLPWLCVFGIVSVFDIINSNSLSYVRILFIQFWFIAASCFSLLYITLLHRAFSLRTILIIASALHLVGIFGDGYYGFTAYVPFIRRIYDGYFSVMLSTRWGLFFGMFYICLGMYLTKQRTEKLKPAPNLILLALCFVAQYFEINWLSTTHPHDFNMYFSLIPISILIYCFIINFGYTKKTSVNYKKVSVYIYITHTFFLYLIAQIFDGYNFRAVFILTLAAYAVLIPAALALRMLYNRKLKGTKLWERIIALVSKAKHYILAILAAGGAVMLILSCFVLPRTYKYCEHLLMLGIIAICIAATLKINFEGKLKKTLCFAALLIMLTSSVLLADFLLLKNYRKPPIFGVDSYYTENTTFYSTMFYEAYISNKDAQQPVSFEPKGSFDAAKIKKIEEYY